MLLFALKPSKIDVGGIGVFATANIRSGTRLPLFSKKDYRFIRNAMLKKFSPRIRQYVRMHSVKDAAGYHAPEDFNRMSVGWYLNHSQTPNVAHRSYRYFALRAIKEEEELTIDYGTLEEDGVERFVRKHCRG